MPETTIPDDPSATNASRQAVSLQTLAWVFLRLGLVSFGGPAAHIAVMEEEVVRRRGWMTHDEFLDLIGAANLIPGPNSTEVAIHVGFKVAGWPGLLIAGIGFILPATVIVAALAWVYVTYRQLPQLNGVLYAVKPVVIAVVAQALWNLGRSCLKTKWLAAVAMSVVVLTVLGVNEILLLFGTGLFLLLVRGLVTRGMSIRLPLLTVLAWPGWPTASGTTPAVGVWPLFAFFLKVGSVLFGSGYVLLAFLRADLVERYGWLTERQLLDAIAVGQVTPGPLFTTATFIGYVLAGPSGALVATVGIFLPAFVFVAISVPILPRLRNSTLAGAFLDGVNVASWSLMAVVTWHLGRAALVDVPTAMLAIISIVLILRWKVNSAWLILVAVLIGLVAG